METLIERMRVYFVVDTLEYLQKGGRIGGARALLSTVLSIKPVLMIQEGRVEPLKKVRTRRKALRQMIDLMAQEMSGYDQVHVAVLHAQAEDEAKAVAEQVQAAMPGEEFFISEIGTALGTNTGPGVIGLAAYGD
jgi:DegV family protein with EDD domain